MNKDQRGYRLTSIDMLRGLVIVIMAIDHVRDYFLVGTTQDPTSDPNVPPSLFFTRWITHYCAPTFVTLAGVSAGLMTSRKSRGELTRFLLTRGLWLVFVEMAIVSTATTLSPGGIPELGGKTLIIMQVIWAIGASMIVLAGAQWLGRTACLAIGLAILLGHNALDGIWPTTKMLAQAPVWTTLHSQSMQTLGPLMLLMAYPLLPWVGVMLFGFGIAPVFELPAERRNRLLLRAGCAMTVGFVVLRMVSIYGDPNPWQSQPGGTVATIIDFLNTTKYPPSLLFLLMTLGPAAILCSIADRFGGPIKDALVMFGRVPFAFYVAHVYLIHLMSITLGVAQGFRVSQLLTPFIFYPKGYGVSLPGMYLAWAILIALLYPFCRWVAGVKARRKDWWLSYL